MAYRDEVYFQAPAEPEVAFDEEEFTGQLPVHGDGGRPDHRASCSGTKTWESRGGHVTFRREPAERPRPGR